MRLKPARYWPVVGGGRIDDASNDREENAE